MTRRLLVTGGAGFIGANFVHHWLTAHPGDRVVVLDALTYAGNRASLAQAAANPAFAFVQADICDEARVEQVMVEQRIDTLVHFAAESHVDRSVADPGVFVTTNVIGTHALLRVAREVWQTRRLVEGPVRFHHVSTDEVYGSLGPDDAPFSETTPYAPNSPYAASKAASDHFVCAYAHTYGLPVTTTNCSNNYGPYQFPEKLIPLMLINALTGKALPIYGDGLNVRDWLHVHDHARAIDLVLDRGRLGETYNIGGKCERTNIDIVNTLCRALEQAFAADPTLADRFPDAPAARGGAFTDLITYVKDRPGHDRRYAIDPTLAEGELGYVPAHTFDTGLAQTIAWYLDNEAWWRAVMDQSYRSWIDTQYGAAGAG